MLSRSSPSPHRVISADLFRIHFVRANSAVFFSHRRRVSIPALQRVPSSRLFLGRLATLPTPPPPLAKKSVVPALSWQLSPPAVTFCFYFVKVTIFFCKAPLFHFSVRLFFTSFNFSPIFSFPVLLAGRRCLFLSSPRFSRLLFFSFCPFRLVPHPHPSSSKVPNFPFAFPPKRLFPPDPLHFFFQTHPFKTLFFPPPNP